jgi:hypothetical protein
VTLPRTIIQTNTVAARHQARLRLYRNRSPRAAAHISRRPEMPPSTPPPPIGDDDPDADGFDADDLDGFAGAPTELRALFSSTIQLLRRNIYCVAIAEHDRRLNPHSHFLCSLGRLRAASRIPRSAHCLPPGLRYSRLASLPKMHLPAAFISVVIPHAHRDQGLDECPRADHRRSILRPPRARLREPSMDCQRTAYLDCCGP